MEKIRYFIREGLKNIWVNRMMSIASICILTVCLLLLGTSVLISINVRNLMHSVEQQNQIGVFLKDGIDQPTIDKIGTDLKAMPNVLKVEFISKDQALQNEKKQLGKDQDLLNGVNQDNFFPNSYRVTLKSMQSYNLVVKKIHALANIESVNEHSGVAEKLNSISNTVSWAGFWLFILLAAVSLFIIVYTIKLAVYVRRREVNIMKFVGATDWFIRWPFFVEGLLIGVFSGIVGSIFQWYLYGALVKRLFSALHIIHPLAYRSVGIPLSLGFIASGIVLGIVGSLISVHKYLRV
ncbi:MAG: permease-like cell division protein FtsX [Ethanoligenens sp.]|uniref:permease-like cell division protein FtsX n=1 Tax=Ethanoligenens sp. TaxID=2099655 RepID=UPI0039ED5613